MSEDSDCSPGHVSLLIVVDKDGKEHWASAERFGSATWLLQEGGKRTRLEDDTRSENGRTYYIGGSWNNGAYRFRRHV